MQPFSVPLKSFSIFELMEIGWEYKPSKYKNISLLRTSSGAVQFSTSEHEEIQVPGILSRNFETIQPFHIGFFKRSDATSISKSYCELIHFSMKISDRSFSFYNHSGSFQTIDITPYDFGSFHMLHQISSYNDRDIGSAINLPNPCKR